MIKRSGSIILALEVLLAGVIVPNLVKSCVNRWFIRPHGENVGLWQAGPEKRPILSGHVPLSERENEV
jgi:hypothetical protein